MEIKFRGLRTDGKGWAYGDLLHDAFDGTSKYVPFGIREKIKGHYNYSVEVTPETVGMFTGLHDKNGKEIYLGDILREPAKNNWEEINYSCFEVFFHDGDANSDYNIGFSINRMHNHGAICGGYIPSFKPKTTKRMIVIGNVYEHPELLK